jgi:hypothetical protein
MDDGLKKDTESFDIDINSLGRPEAIVGLGQTVAAGLLTFGTCTFAVNEQGKIVVLNPQAVFIDSQVAQPPPGTEMKFIRPVLSNRKPKYVALHPEHGGMWEVEFQPRGIEEETDAPLSGD